jgi:hypothetical protein
VRGDDAPKLLDTPIASPPDWERRECNVGAAPGIARRAESTPARAGATPASPVAPTAPAGLRRERLRSFDLFADFALLAAVAALTVAIFFGAAAALWRQANNSSGAGRLLDANRAPAARPAPAPPMVARAASLAPAPSGGAVAMPVPTAAITASAAKTATAEPDTGLAAKAIGSAQLPDVRLDALVMRGDAFLRAGDIASARLFYERAAEKGDGQAAMLAGATFDPAVLASIGLQRMQGDAARALFWYRRALGLGADNAAPE